MELLNIVDDLCLLYDNYENGIVSGTVETKIIQNSIKVIVLQNRIIKDVVEYLFVICKVPQSYKNNINSSKKYVKNKYILSDEANEIIDKMKKLFFYLNNIYYINKYINNMYANLTNPNIDENNTFILTIHKFLCILSYKMSFFITSYKLTKNYSEAYENITKVLNQINTVDYFINNKIFRIAMLKIIRESLVYYDISLINHITGYDIYPYECRKDNLAEYYLQCMYDLNFFL